MPYDISTAAAKARAAATVSPPLIRLRNETIVEMVRKGCSFTKIGKHFDISRQRVHQIAKLYGVVTKYGTKGKEKREARQRRREDRNNREAAFATDLRREVKVNGLSVLAAARKLGLSRMVAHRLATKYCIRSIYKGRWGHTIGRIK